MDSFIQQLNEWGQRSVPFLFLIDFEMKKPIAWPLDQVDANKIWFDIHGISNAPVKEEISGNLTLSKFPISLEDYRPKFDQVSRHLSWGDSYLVNLTTRTRIEINLSLQEIFYLSKARYKCWFKNQFLFFSPEIFVQIRAGKIFSYPMKGTIDASLPNAAQQILQDKKELAEHITITDLIRNDLSRISSDVTVTRFRYLEEIVTHDQRLLQVSSEVCGTLTSDYQNRLGDIIVSLLPAGSVSGAPKTKTCEVIATAEGEPRGYYTGVIGLFDGVNLDSGVAIRFLEQKNNSIYFRSGGGITTQSNLKKEYQELIQKIYVPVA